MIKKLCSIIKWSIGLFFTYKAAELLYYWFVIPRKPKVETPIDVMMFGIIGIIFLLILMLAWLMMTPPKKCPVCKSENIKLDSIKEIDRWIGKTKAREKLASGKIKERYLQCTKVKKRYTYCCKNPNCNHQFTEIREEEL